MKIMAKTSYAPGNMEDYSQQRDISGDGDEELSGEVQLEEEMAVALGAAAPCAPFFLGHGSCVEEFLPYWWLPMRGEFML